MSQSSLAGFDTSLHLVLPFGPPHHPFLLKTSAPQEVDSLVASLRPTLVSFCSTHQRK